VAESVLIVEDQRAFAFALQEVLAGDGHRVETAASVADALAKIDRERFDVALLDLRIGGESGLTVLAHLKATSPQTAALVLTGYGSLETAIQALRAGASDYLLKPCDPAELKQAIARGVGQRRSNSPPWPPTMQEEAARAFEQAQRARDDFLAIAGHEFKTPLAAILGWTQYAQRQLQQGRTEGISEKLDVVVGQAERLARLIDTCGELVRLQHGGITLNRLRRDFRLLVQDSVARARRAHLRHEIQLRLPESPVWVLIDSPRLERVLDNLLENAAKFSADGTTIGVELATLDDEARLAIADEGIGIAPEELTRVFNRFYQGERDILSRRFGGIGIGLFLSRLLVEAHGGRIWAESPVTDGGSTFSVALPLTTSIDI
jgi:signal transduction histidine kinase